LGSARVKAVHKHVGKIDHKIQLVKSTERIICVREKGAEALAREICLNLNIFD